MTSKLVPPNRKSYPGKLQGCKATARMLQPGKSSCGPRWSSCRSPQAILHRLEAARQQAAGYHLLLQGFFLRGFLPAFFETHSFEASSFEAAFFEAALFEAAFFEAALRGKAPSVQIGEVSKKSKVHDHELFFDFVDLPRPATSG